MQDYSQPPAPPTFQQPFQSQQMLKPHRGGVVLALGILGIVVCFICGIIAWVMGKNDLQEMEAGVMDPSGRDITNAGRIYGLIGFVLGCIGQLGVCCGYCSRWASVSSA